MNFFKPEDFNLIKFRFGRAHGSEVAQIANRLLQERGVRVYAEPCLGARVDAKEQPTPDGLTQMRTHQALLVCIEELPKKECEHEPTNYHYHEIVPFESKREGLRDCKHCGIQLKLEAKWEKA